MTTVHHVFVGAVKSAEGGKGGVFRQALGSQRWEALDNGVPGDAEVHAVTVDPNATDTVMIATTKGAFKTRWKSGIDQEVALGNEYQYGYPFGLIPRFVDYRREWNEMRANVSRMSRAEARGSGSTLLRVQCIWRSCPAGTLWTSGRLSDPSGILLIPSRPGESRAMTRPGGRRCWPHARHS